MKPRDLILGILSGCVLIAFGLIPGLVQDLIRGIANFQNELLPNSQHVEYGRIQQPVFLAWIGTALIVLTVFAYTWA